MILALVLFFSSGEAFYQQQSWNRGTSFNGYRRTDLFPDKPDSLVSSISSQLSSLTSLMESLSTGPEGRTRELLHGVQFTHCIQSLPKAVQLLRRLGQIVSDTDPLVKRMEADLESLKEERYDLVASMRISARLLDTLDTIPEMMKALPTSPWCPYGDGYTNLYEISTFLESLSHAPAIQQAVGVAEQLKKSGLIVRETTNFLGKLKASFSRMPNICSREPDITIKGIQAVNDIFNVVEELFNKIGYNINLAEIRQSSIVNVHTIMNKIYLLKQMDYPLYGCDSLVKSGIPGSDSDLKTLSQALKDLSTVVQDVGLEELEQELGVNLNFNFI